MTAVRTCTKCGETKSLTEFSPNRPRCKACRRVEENARYQPIKELNARKRAEMQIRVTKTCSKCGQEKPLSAFYRYHKNEPKVRANCIECQKKYKASALAIVSAKKYSQSEKGRESQYRRNKKHRVEIIARYTLNNAIKLGHVERPNKCSMCGSDKDVQAHHADYNEPLRVIFLCRKCHTKLHLERGKVHVE